MIVTEGSFDLKRFTGVDIQNGSNRSDFENVLRLTPRNLKSIVGRRRIACSQSTLAGYGRDFSGDNVLNQRVGFRTYHTVAHFTVLVLKILHRLLRIGTEIARTRTGKIAD
jgi:hypothetical protein